ncbi:uncharacterized protein LOC116178914 isoform X2 [Photinus pyralis]|uniref:uncharacterized protein LOC116178914 isoform X2 n=1 Tax=Photinus pyralis TaxID=7054 RepID=UPI0012673C57|nr:uncharacterized protein LOC116178914 isoform X2 [Photinus pyralis]
MWDNLCVTFYLLIYGEAIRKLVCRESGIFREVWCCLHVPKGRNQTMQRVIEISGELKETIEAVTPRFEENLKRAFQNEGLRRENLAEKKDRLHPLDDVLFSVGDNIIELKDLKLTKTPDYRISSLSADFAMLTLHVTINLGDLKIEGDYEANNKTLQYFLPIVHTGKVRITFENVTATGRIGMFIKEDSFVVEHYDLVYTPRDVAVLVLYKEENSDVRVENEIARQKVEDTIALTFWPELKDTVTRLLHRQLQTVIVEESVNDLFGESDVELRNHAHQLILKANRLVDSLLCTAKSKIVSGSVRMVEAPELNVIFKGRHPSQEQGLLEARGGYVQDLSTLSRCNNVSFYEDEKDVIIYGSLHLREFKYGYENYKGRQANASVGGSIRGMIYRNKIFVKLSLSKSQEHCVTQLEAVQFRSVNDIEVLVSGLGSLSWLAKNIKTWMIGNLRNEVLLILENKIRNAFDYAIQITDCAALLID